MENKRKQKTKMVKVPQEGLLSLVASVLRDKVLFPEKLEDARDHLRSLQPVKR